MNLSDATVTQLLIPVEDFERSVSFYRDVLGIPLLFSAPPQMAFFQCGAIRLLVGVTPAGQKAQRGSAIYFSVRDIEGVHASLREKGVEFKAPPHVVNRSGQSETWLAEFVDPDGNQLALLSQRQSAALNHTTKPTFPYGGLICAIPRLGELHPPVCQTPSV